MSVRINIGCGMTPTKGWKNYDNSWSVRLSNIPLLVWAIRKFGLFSKPQQDFISFSMNSGIRWADACCRIPEKSSAVDVVYSSHMIEHMEKADAIRFLVEVRRVLKSGGIIRIAVPNIRYHVESYLKDNNADSFIEGTHLTREAPKTIVEKMKYIVIGDRNHQWMYDGESLRHLIESAGFIDSEVMAPGTTRIADSGELDLYEGVPESVFVEAVNP